MDQSTTLAKNPNRRYMKALLLPAQKRQKNKDVYERCRRSWKVAKKHRSGGTEEQAAHAIAIVGGVSVGAYRIIKWNRLEDEKWEFEGLPHAELEKLNWRAIIKPAMGYWQRGNYLIVEFDGTGRFRIVRGSRKRPWLPCIEESEATATPPKMNFTPANQSTGCQGSSSSLQSVELAI